MCLHLHAAGTIHGIDHFRPQTRHGGSRVDEADTNLCLILPQNLNTLVFLPGIRSGPDGTARGKTVPQIVLCRRTLIGRAGRSPEPLPAAGNQRYRPTLRVGEQHLEIPSPDTQCAVSVRNTQRGHLFHRQWSSGNLTLGAYGFPDNGTEVIRLEQDEAQAIVLKGRDFTGREKQLAMTVYGGWKRLNFLRSQNTNSDSEHSIIVYAETARRELYQNGPYILISQVITKESHEDFTTDEIFPIRSVSYSDPENWGSYGAVTVEWKDKHSSMVDFDGIEGKLSL